jgi:hypothetical protein
MRGAADEKLASLMLEVAVPDGLAERILAHLASVGEGTASLKTVGRPFRRRTWLIGLVGFATASAAAILSALWLGFGVKPTLSEQYVLDEAVRAFESALDEQAPWPVFEPAPADDPPSEYVAGVSRAKVARLDGRFGGSRVRAYNLPSSDGKKATLFVIDASPDDDLGSSPPLRPFTTGGCAAGAWQERGLVCVLVVRGGVGCYRSYLQVPRSPIA